MLRVRVPSLSPFFLSFFSKNRKQSLQKANPDFGKFHLPVRIFYFCLIFFAMQKKWDCSLRFGLPSLRSGSLRFARVESLYARFIVPVLHSATREGGRFFIFTLYFLHGRKRDFFLGLPSLHSGSSARCAAVESRLDKLIFLFLPVRIFSFCLIFLRCKKNGTAHFVSGCRRSAPARRRFAPPSSPVFAKYPVWTITRT